jgi:hypothetical protein
LAFRPGVGAFAKHDTPAEPWLKNESQSKNGLAAKRWRSATSFGRGSKYCHLAGEELAHRDQTLEKMKQSSPIDQSACEPRGYFLGVAQPATVLDTVYFGQNFLPHRPVERCARIALRKRK